VVVVALLVFSLRGLIPFSTPSVSPPERLTRLWDKVNGDVGKKNAAGETNPDRAPPRFLRSALAAT
jgi:hypothetical protein